MFDPVFSRGPGRAAINDPGANAWERIPGRSASFRARQFILSARYSSQKLSPSNRFHRQAAGAGPHDRPSL